MQTTNLPILPSGARYPAGGTGLKGTNKWSSANMHLKVGGKAVKVGVFFRSSNRLFYLTGNRDYLSMCWISLHAAHQLWHNKVLKMMWVFVCGLACCENCRYQAGFQTEYLSCCAGWWAGEKRGRGCPSLPCSPATQFPHKATSQLAPFLCVILANSYCTKKSSLFILPATRSEARLHIFFPSQSAPSLHD